MGDGLAFAYRLPYIRFDFRSHLLTATEVSRCIAVGKVRCLLLCIGVI